MITGTDAWHFKKYITGGICGANFTKISKREKTDIYTSYTVRFRVTLFWLEAL